MIRLGSNIEALSVQRKLAGSTAAATSAVERLASGMRINRAADDPAALALVQSLNAEVRLYSQAVRNVNDGISALSIAEAAFQSLTDISIRQKELAAQAANGVYSVNQRRSMNQEANVLVDEFNRIVSSVKFNGIRLLDPKTGEISIQAGIEAGSGVGFSLGASLSRTFGDGSFASAITFPLPGESQAMGTVTGDFTGDGIADIVVSGGTTGTQYLLASNGDGTFAAPKSFGLAGRIYRFAGTDLDNDGDTDIVAGYGPSHIYLANGDGTFKSGAVNTPGVLGVGTADFNNDGKDDIFGLEMAAGRMQILLGNGDGTFHAARIFGLEQGGHQAATGDFNGDGKMDLASIGLNSGGFSVLLGNGDGTFQRYHTFGVPGAAWGALSIQSADLNRDGYADIVAHSSPYEGIFLSNGDGTFRTAASFSMPGSNYSLSLSDLNGDGLNDMVTASWNPGLRVRIGNGDGTFGARVDLPTGGAADQLSVGDFNGDGALDLTVNDYASGAFAVLLGNACESAEIAYLDLNTVTGAREAMQTIDGTLQRLTQGLSELGASRSRLSIAAANLSTAGENAAAAAGRIMDADVAHETSALLRSQILQQAAAAVLAQATQQPALALTLL